MPASTPSESSSSDEKIPSLSIITKKNPKDRSLINSIPDFIRTSLAVDGAAHCIGITTNNVAYTWGRTNHFGQLGRLTKNTKIPQPVMFSNPNSKEKENDSFDVRAIWGYVGGMSDSGHSAILGSDGYLWLSGCDRWQQLGLGSSNSGSTGYTWKNGQLWQQKFQRNVFLTELMERDDCQGNALSSSKNDKNTIRDVSLGGDHTVVLSKDKMNVYTFGKGGEGQLGLPGKPFVSAPAKSKKLSSKKANIGAVCAIQNCSLTLDDNGNILSKVGKCRMDAKGMMESLLYCQEMSKQNGLINHVENNQ